MKEKAVATAIADLVTKLSLEEKIALVPTHQMAIERLGLCEFHIGGEAAHGLVSPTSRVTVFPETIGMAASWDEELLRKIGALVADEAEIHYAIKGSGGGLMLWAPTVDMERDGRWGRNGEGYGEDPLLTSRLAASYMRGLIGDTPGKYRVAPTLKHFYANNNEDGRLDGSSSLDPREKREYYLRVYERLIQSVEVPSIMTAYNAIDGIPAMIHPDILSILRGEWDWQGCLVCDGGALSLLVEKHRAAPSYAAAAALALNAGVDVLTDDRLRVTEAIREAIATGLLSLNTLNTAISRTLTVRSKLGALFSRDTERSPKANPAELYRPESGQLAREAARESIVLLKNEASILPLDPRAIRKLAVIGPLANESYRDWYGGEASYARTPLKAFVERLGSERVSFSAALDHVAFQLVNGSFLGVSSWNDPRIVADRTSIGGNERFEFQDWGWDSTTIKSLANGRYLSLAGRGIADEHYVSADAPSIWGWFVKERFEGLLARDWSGKPLTIDESGYLARGTEGSGLSASKVVLRDGIAEAVMTAESADAVILVVGTHPLINGKEEIDRESLELPPAQEALIRAVAKVNKRVIVVLESNHPIACDPWMEAVSAILHTPQGGQEAGNGLADIIFGNESPSGRLPMTWPRSTALLPPIRDYRLREGGRTYRYQKEGVLFPFGYGLSYSHFTYESIKMEGDFLAANPGRQIDFFAQSAFRVWILLRNQGPCAARETVQLYCRLADQNGAASPFPRPKRELIDFAQKRIESRETIELQFIIQIRDLAIWDPDQKRWIIEAGEYLIEAGPSSEQLPLRLSFQLPKSELGELSF